MLLFHPQDAAGASSTCFDAINVSDIANLAMAFMYQCNALDGSNLFCIFDAIDALMHRCSRCQPSMMSVDIPCLICTDVVDAVCSWMGWPGASLMIFWWKMVSVQIDDVIVFIHDDILIDDVGCIHKTMIEFIVDVVASFVDDDDEVVDVVVCVIDIRVVSDDDDDDDDDDAIVFIGDYVVEDFVCDVDVLDATDGMMMLMPMLW